MCFKYDPISQCFYERLLHHPFSLNNNIQHSEIDLLFEWNLSALLKFVKQLKKFNPVIIPSFSLIPGAAQTSGGVAGSAGKRGRKAPHFKEIHPELEGAASYFNIPEIMPQPEWDLDSPPIDEVADEHDDIISEEDFPDDETSCSRPCRDSVPASGNSRYRYDIHENLAWYVPIHYSFEKYGIYFNKYMINRFAADIEKSCPQALPPEIALVAASVSCYWHEVFHAWVEDLCTIAETITGIDYYSNANAKYGSYIVMEESLANSLAISSSNIFFSNENFQNDIISSLKKMFASQPKGYNRFKIFGENGWCIDDDLFLKNVFSLLKHIYKIPSSIALHALRQFFSPAVFTFGFSNKELENNPAFILKYRYIRKCLCIFSEACMRNGEYPHYLL